MTFPRSWLKRLRPTTLRTKTTMGAKSPLPSFTLPIRGRGRVGRAAATRRTAGTRGVATRSPPPRKEDPNPAAAAGEREAAAMDKEGEI